MHALSALSYTLCGFPALTHTMTWVIRYRRKPEGVGLEDGKDNRKSRADLTHATSAAVPTPAVMMEAFQDAFLEVIPTWLRRRSTVRSNRAVAHPVSRFSIWSVTRRTSCFAARVGQEDERESPKFNTILLYWTIRIFDTSTRKWRASRRCVYLIVWFKNIRVRRVFIF